MKGSCLCGKWYSKSMAKPARSINAIVQSAERYQERAPTQSFGLNRKISAGFVVKVL